MQVKVRRPPPPSPPLSLTDSKSSRSESFAPPPPIQEEEVLELEEAVPMMPAPITMHQPDITQHFVDDVYLRTIQGTNQGLAPKPLIKNSVAEKKIIEDIDRQKRQVTQYHTEPKLLPPQVWDVTIKNYPLQSHPPQWEDFSDVSSASGRKAP